MNRKVMGSIMVGLVVLVGVVGIALAVREPSKTNDTPLSEHSPSQHGQQKTNDNQNEEPTPAATTNKVAITDFVYTPKTITVKKGTTVTWTNNDTVAHTVTVNEGEGPDSELFGKGETYSYAFNKVGTFDYYCKPHPNMTGTVIVTD